MRFWMTMKGCWTNTFKRTKHRQADWIPPSSNVDLSFQRLVTRQVHSLRNLLSPWILGTNRLKCTMYQRCPKTIAPLWAHQGHETHPASQTARFASHLVVSLYNFEIVKMVSSFLGNVINTIKTINTISTINVQECPGMSRNLKPKTLQTLQDFLDEFWVSDCRDIGGGRNALESNIPFLHGHAPP